MEYPLVLGTSYSYRGSIGSCPCFTGKSTSARKNSSTDSNFYTLCRNGNRGGDNLEVDSGDPIWNSELLLLSNRITRDQVVDQFENRNARNCIRYYLVDGWF